MSVEQRQQIISLIDQARSEGARLNPACQCAEIDAATYRRWQCENGKVLSDLRATAQRAVPHNKLTTEERELILLTCHLPHFQSLPPSQIVPTLADMGCYIGSESSFYRVLHDAAEQNDRGRARVRQQRAKPMELVATKANQCWAWDVTFLKAPVRGQFYYLYMMMDIFSRKITAWEVYDTESGDYAAELLQRGVLAEGCASTLRCLHADNGSIQRSSTLRAKMQWLGIEPSYSRPRVSNDNPMPEALFRHVKYRPDFPHDGFESIEEARKWCGSFVSWYNEEHKHSSIKFVTPVQRHNGEDIEILLKRDELYKQAKAMNPSRWSGETRNWKRSDTVIYNQDKKKGKLEKAA